MNKDQIIYQLSVEDVLTVAKEMKLKIKETDIPFIEDKIGNFIDWYQAIEFTLYELQNSKKSTN